MKPVMMIDVESIGFITQVGIGSTYITSDLERDGWLQEGFVFRIDVRDAVNRLKTAINPDELLFWFNIEGRNPWSAEKPIYEGYQTIQSPNVPFSFRRAYTFNAQVTTKSGKVVTNKITGFDITLDRLPKAMEYVYKRTNPSIIVAHIYDFEMLDNTWRLLNMKNAPIPYSIRRDISTLAYVTGKVESIFSNPLPHDAIYDVIYQFGYVIPILRKISKVKELLTKLEV